MGQYRADHGIGGAVEVGEEVTGGKRQKKPEPQASGGGVNHACSGFTWNVVGGGALPELLRSQPVRCSILCRQCSAMPGVAASFSRSARAGRCDCQSCIASAN